MKNLFYPKLLRFFSFGLLTYGGNIWVSYVLIEMYWVNVYIAYLFALSCTIVLNFFISTKYIFVSRYTKQTLFRYVAVLALVAGANYISVLIIHSLYMWTNIYALIFVITTLFAFVKFLLYDKYVFIQQW